ncbi:MAG: Toxin Doc [Pseudomonadota bacterium]|jgi:death-on-curing protein
MSRGPVFLGVEEVFAIHAEQVEFYGGSPGIRDTALLESALGAPEASFGGTLLHPTIPEMAAAYLFHLVKNHPFVDGNKRTGLAVALGFLGLNGHWLEATEDDVVDLVLGVAEGRTSKAEVAEFIRQHLQPL